MVDLTKSYTPSDHALERWQERAPKGFTDPGVLQAFVREGVVIRERGSRAYVFHRGLVLVVEGDCLVTFWPISPTKAHRWRVQYLREHGDDVDTADSC